MVMKSLSEKEIREWFEYNAKSEKMPNLYFKSVKVKGDFYGRCSGNLHFPNGEAFRYLDGGKKYDLWLMETETNQLIVFVPGLSEGMCADNDFFGDWKNAPDSTSACYGGVEYQMIRDCHGQRILVEKNSLYLDEVERLIDTECAYCSPELVIDGQEWYIGWAFYKYMHNCNYPNGKPEWMAFFRIDKQQFISKEECESSYNKLKVTLTCMPVRIKDMKISFVCPNVIDFEFA